jgi:hypothetical protein
MWTIEYENVMTPGAMQSSLNHSIIVNVMSSDVIIRISHDDDDDNAS